jgi:hypothetical protein
MTPMNSNVASPRPLKTSFSRRTRLTSALAVGLFAAFCARSANATVLWVNDFEGGQNSWTPNNNASEWSLDATSEGGNKFFKRLAGGTSWSDAFGISVFGDIALEANIRINSWNSSSQNRVFLIVRANGSTPDSTTAYQVSIAPNGTIALERRGVNKAITTLATAQSMDIVGASWTPGVWNLIRLEVSGTMPAKLSLYVNGVRLATASDSTGGYDTGHVGFGAAGASADFDDISGGDFAEFSDEESGESAELLSHTSAPTMVCQLVSTVSSIL